VIDDITLREIAVKTGVPLGTIKKDLAITCALKAISTTRLKNHLVFKGGTAIKKIYDASARFSEDLDFTTIGLLESEASEAISTLERTQVDPISFRDISEDGYTRQGKRYRLAYIGPLEYINSIRIDLSFREDIIEEIEEKSTHSEYGTDLEAYVKALSFNEIIAEKIRAMMTRESPRDYYDVYHHLHKIKDKNHMKNLVVEKCRLVGYDYEPENILSKEKLQRIESLWKIQLQHLLPKCPEFKNILPSLTTRIGFLT
jgi:hypothetical protein